MQSLMMAVIFVCACFFCSFVCFLPFCKNWFQSIKFVISFNWSSLFWLWAIFISPIYLKFLKMLQLSRTCSWKTMLNNITFWNSILLWTGWNLTILCYLIFQQLSSSHWLKSHWLFSLLYQNVLKKNHLRNLWISITFSIFRLMFYGVLVQIFWFPLIRMYNKPLNQKQ